MNLDLPAFGRHLLRQLAIGLPLCTFIAYFLSVAFKEPFGRVLVFSYCIGLSCQFLIDAGRHAAVGWMRQRGVPAPTGWPAWRWTVAIIAAAVWGGMQIGYRLGGALLGMDVPVPGLDDWRSLFIIGTVCIAASLVMTASSWARARVAASDAQAERAQRAATENQLKLLESQLEPHMLFNTLANLRVLIGADPPRAQAMLDRLIAFLRATLEASRVGTHPLAAEFERLADYLALMQVRMGARLATRFELPDALRNAPLPPLLLQPLVENAIRHGLEPKVEGGRIDVCATREGDALVLTVHDTGVGLSPNAATQGTRFGMQQVRERLATLYGERATLSLSPADDGGTLARVSLPWTEPPA